MRTRIPQWLRAVLLWHLVWGTTCTTPDHKNDSDKHEIMKSQQLRGGRRTLKLDDEAFWNNFLTDFFGTDDNNKQPGGGSKFSLPPTPAPTTPSERPSAFPSNQPTETPSTTPSERPSVVPSISPSSNPTNRPSQVPSDVPSIRPSFTPSVPPTNFPSLQPSNPPSMVPSGTPSTVPSTSPSRQPSNTPTISANPSTSPSSQPSNTPTISASPSVSSQPTIAVLPNCEPLDQTFESIRGQNMAGRIQRSPVPIPVTCDQPRPFPGTFGASRRFFNIIGPFVNDSPNERCATLVWDYGTCWRPGIDDQGVEFEDVLVHPSVYNTSSFDRNDLSIGYISTSATSEVANFSFVLGPRQRFDFVAQGVVPITSGLGGGVLGCQYSIAILFDECFTDTPTALPSSTPNASPSTSPSTSVAPSVSPTDFICLAECDFANATITESSPTSNGAVLITSEVSTCTEEKVFPGIVNQGGEIPYERIGPFCNESPQEACAIVNIDFSACQQPSGLPLAHVVAYSSFNPANVSQNYLGDGQLSSNFEIPLQSQEKFFLVGFFSIQLNQTLLPCTFSVSVDFGQCTPSEAPSSVPSLIPSEAPSIVPTQRQIPTFLPNCETLPQIFTRVTGQNMDGRLERNDTMPSNCDGPRPFPGVIGTEPRFFNLVGPFVNDSPNERCATLVWNFGTCTRPAVPPETGFDVLVHPSVYTSFDPDDLSSGYISDSGSSDAANFSFLVRGGEQFLFVAQAVEAIENDLGGGVLGCQYSIAVLFDDCVTDAPTALPTAVPTSPPTLSPTNVPTCSTIESTFANNSETTTGRIRRSSVVSTCENNKQFPGTIFSTPFLFNVIGPFVNTDAEAQCVTIEWDQGTCTANGEILLQPMAYTQFDPSNQASGYLGDGGLGEEGAFSFFVPPQTEFVFVAQEAQPSGASQPGLAVGCSYSIRVLLDCPDINSSTAGGFTQSSVQTISGPTSCTGNNCDAFNKALALKVNPSPDANAKRSSYFNSYRSANPALRRHSDPGN